MYACIYDCGGVCLCVRLPRVHEHEDASERVEQHVNQVVAEGLKGREVVVEAVRERREGAVALVAVRGRQRRPPEIVHQDLPRRVLPVHVRVLDLQCKSGHREAR